MPHVSVILPVYNAEFTIKKAVESTLAQRFTDFELLIINDGSSDGTEKELQILTDNRLRIIHTSHNGIAKSLNYGIAQSQGSYIARMDADDMMHPDRLMAQVSYLDTHPEIGVVASRVNYVDQTNPSQDTTGYQWYVKWQNGLITPDQHANNRFVDAPVAHPSVMFRKSIFEEFGGYSEEPVPEDYELWLRWMSHQVRFYKLEQILLDWCDHPKRLSRIHPHYHQEAFYALKAHYFRKWYKSNSQGRSIWICGFGAAVNKRLRHFDLPVTGFVDVNNNPAPHVITYDEIHKLNQPLLLSFVSDRSGKIRIKNFLINSGFIEGSDFWMMA